MLPFVSDTALLLAPEEERQQWTKGAVIERRAAGLTRTVVFNPYPEAQAGGRVDILFRVEIAAPDGQPLATEQGRVQADSTDVACVEDWTQVLQRDAVSTASPANGQSGWFFRTDLGDSASHGNCLEGHADAQTQIRQLTYPLDLRGHYALFVSTGGSAQLRLSGDERSDHIGDGGPRGEVFWRWTSMDRQNLIVKQEHGHTGWRGARMDYVRFVPLSPRATNRRPGCEVLRRAGQVRSLLLGTL